jgi:hypothetical protein
MSRVILVIGSLAPVACREIIENLNRDHLSVLEFEICMPINARPLGVQWVNARDYHGIKEYDRIDDQANELLEIFLESDGACYPDLELSRAFRAACLGMDCRKLINPYLVNLDIAIRFFASRPSFDQIIVAPGAGISFKAWRQIAKLRGLPIRFLPVEKHPWSFRRKILRLQQRWRLCNASIKKDHHAQQLGSMAEICCASSRVARILGSPNDLSWSYVSESSFGSPPANELAELKARYKSWWQSREDYYNQLIQKKPASPFSVLIDLGRQQVSEVYPVFAWKYQRALRHLEVNRPRLLIVDTQEGSHDLAWALAGKKLGIPVAVYTYDFLVEPKFSLQPDWVLCDSGRQSFIAMARGLADTSIVRVDSMRKPKLIRLRNERRSDPVIIYADTYYSGVTATVDPQQCRRNYITIIETARQMPECLFQIKFHPLRGRKKEHQSFAAMDEHELYLSTQFIQSLNPPKNIRLIAPEKNILPYLEAADVVLNSNSIVGLEAFQIGIPVIFLDPPDTRTGFPRINDYGACELARNSEELQSELLRLLSNSNHAQGLVARQRRYVDEFYWGVDSQTLAQGIQSILSKLDTVSHTASTGTPAAGPNF